MEGITFTLDELLVWIPIIIAWGLAGICMFILIIYSLFCLVKGLFFSLFRKSRILEPQTSLTKEQREYIDRELLKQEIKEELTETPMVQEKVLAKPITK